MDSGLVYRGNPERERDENEARVRRAVSRSLAHEQKAHGGDSVLSCRTCMWHSNAVQRARDKAGHY